MNPLIESNPAIVGTNHGRGDTVETRGGETVEQILEAHPRLTRPAILAPRRSLESVSSRSEGLWTAGSMCDAAEFIAHGS